jgi:hypothetical protein
MAFHSRKIPLLALAKIARRLYYPAEKEEPDGPGTY